MDVNPAFLQSMMCPLNPLPQSSTAKSALDLGLNTAGTQLCSPCQGVTHAQVLSAVFPHLSLSPCLHTLFFTDSCRSVLRALLHRLATLSATLCASTVVFSLLLLPRPHQLVPPVSFLPFVKTRHKRISAVCSGQSGSCRSDLLMCPFCRKWAAASAASFLHVRLPSKLRCGLEFYFFK